MSKPCRTCGAEILTRRATQKFCSVECRTIVCAGCDKPFVRVSTTTQKFCSVECFVDHVHVDHEARMLKQTINATYAHMRRQTAKLEARRAELWAA